MIHIDTHTRREAEHEEAKEEMRDDREDYVRSYLSALSSQLTRVRAEVESAISRLGGRQPLDRPHDFAADAEAMVPSIDDLLHGDRVAEFTGRELAKLGIYDGDAISEVASEVMGKVFKV